MFILIIDLFMLPFGMIVYIIHTKSQPMIYIMKTKELSLSAISDTINITCHFYYIVLLSFILTLFDIVFAPVV